MHGKDDHKIPPHHSEALSQAAGSHGALVLVDNADHDSIMADPGGILSRESLAWFDKWLAQQAN